MALEKEIWVRDIIGNLYKNNDFLDRAYNGDANVLNGKVVHIPVAAAASGASKNRAVLPAAVNRRSDTDITYALDEYTSNPILIPNIDNIQLSYDKRASVMQEDMAYIRQLVADWMLRNWATATNITRTTGAATLGMAPGATGNRKALLKEDLKNIRYMMNKANIPNEDRVAVIPSDMMNSLLDDADLKKRDRALELDMKGGVVSRLYGFDLIERSATTVYTNAATPAAKDPGAATAVTDNLAVQCWQVNSVERALGAVDMFEKLGDPTYYGDIYSFLVMMGGRIRRDVGVWSIVEAASA
nr:phage capsid protein [uncultured Arsenicibacter sp.]